MFCCNFLEDFKLLVLLIGLICKIVVNNLKIDGNVSAQNFHVTVETV